MKSELHGAKDSPPTPSRQGASPSQPWMQSSSSSSSLLQRDGHQQLIGGGGFVPNMDLQTLESSFGRLSVLDSDHHRLQGGGAYLFPPESPRNSYASTSAPDQMLNPYMGSSYQYQNQSRWDGFGSGSGINNSWRTTNQADSFLLLAKDTTSSKQLQQTIATASTETFDKIFNHLIPHLSDLMLDPFGHHVILKLMDRCTPHQITRILLFITTNHSLFVRICIDSLGTRAIQSLLKHLHSEDQIMHMVGVISMVALTLTRSNNAKHVILQCFKQFSTFHTRNLLDVIAQYCYRIATDQHGCCMLQQCLGLGCDEIKHRLIAEIIANALKLCVDCYGNYVVQYVAELGDPQVTGELLRQLIGQYGYLSRNKYASHAVQKFLEISYIDSRVIVYDLLRDIDALLLDPYGNYVVQTAWSVSKAEMRNILWWHIRNKKPLMTYNKFGRKLLEMIGM